MSVKIINLNSQENYAPIGLVCISRNKYEKRHLDRKADGHGVCVVSDGFVDLDKEIMSELKNAGLQNILKLQELRYGTLDNAISRASDKGIYADVSNIPTNVAEQSEFVAKAQRDIAKLKAEYGLTDEDLKNLTAEKLVKIYVDRQASAKSSSQEGGAE